MVRTSQFKNVAIAFLTLLILLYFYKLNFCNNSNIVISNIESFDNEESFDNKPNFKDLNCVLNREVAKNVGYKQAVTKKIHCKSDGSEVYVPFSFIKHYYEARGDFVGKSSETAKEFEISHSYSRVYTPASQYRPDGQFMHFRTFNVEARSRVLCLAADTGVPVTTQWDPRGYYYPTQISQFALSHYSSHLANKHKSASLKTVIEGQDKKARLPENEAFRVIDDQSQSLVIEFKTNLNFNINSDKHQTVLCFDFKNLNGAAGFKIILETEHHDKIVLNFLPVEEFLTVKNGEAVFGFGSSVGDWMRVTRDVTIDLEKAQHVLKKKSNSKSKVRIAGLQFYGSGQVTNISVGSEEHLRLFLHGADWLVSNQDQDTGGWPTPVVFNKDRKKYPGADEVGVGWYGAMCQGQAMSVLVRAYANTKDERYLRAAEAGLAVFNISSQQGGVKAMFMEKYVWYEEYPTNPPTFILNGFMYSLLGLYDLKTVSHRMRQQAGELYQAGIESLAAMLPLYDSGYSTFYDLRHFTMRTAPKGARWDYHSTHINLLLELATIEKSLPILKETAERWRGYMIGQKSSHN